MNTKQLCTNSALAALCAVLGYFSISTGNFKLSFETLPIIIGALVMGPLSGAAIGLCGTFVYQLLRYGLMPTTPLWMLPYCVCGLIVGFAAKAGGYKLSRKKTVLLCVIAELAVTTLNTGVLYIDSRVYGYTVAYVFATIIPRYAVCVVKAVAEGFLLPPIVNALSRFGAAKGGVRNDG
ncbi:MAG: folate family ECF transporter S component [Oscillospiraceae bacterium]|nr:folate family ECF transporter S component [Oscillospiraceae bacterium]